MGVYWLVNNKYRRDTIKNISRKTGVIGYKQANKLQPTVTIYICLTSRTAEAIWVALMRRIVRSGLRSDVKTLQIAALSPLYSISEYCSPVCCRIALTRLIDSVLNDTSRIVTECLRILLSDYLPIQASIQPAELR